MSCTHVSALFKGEQTFYLGFREPRPPRVPINCGTWEYQWSLDTENLAEVSDEIRETLESGGLSDEASLIIARRLGVA